MSQPNHHNQAENPDNLSELYDVEWSEYEKQELYNVEWEEPIRKRGFLDRVSEIINQK